jgi:hypothetical protein
MYKSTQQVHTNYLKAGRLAELDKLWESLRRCDWFGDRTLLTPCNNWWNLSSAVVHKRGTVTPETCHRGFLRATKTGLAIKCFQVMWDACFYSSCDNSIFLLRAKKKNSQAFISIAAVRLKHNSFLHFSIISKFICFLSNLYKAIWSTHFIFQFPDPFTSSLWRNISF